MAPTDALVYRCQDQDTSSHYDEAGDFVYGASLRALGFDNIVLDDNGTLIDLAAPDSATVIEGVPDLSTAAVRAAPDGGFYLMVRAETDELSQYHAHRDGSSELLGVYPSLSIAAFEDGVLGADLSYFQLTDEVVVRHHLGEPALVVYDRLKHGAFPVQLATGP